MGVGIGGDYPLSAVISSEFASTRIRGRMMTAVFASQGWGNFSECSPFLIQFPFIFFKNRTIAAALVALIITAAYKSSIQGDSVGNGYAHIDQVWRLLIGLGCVPAVVALYFRLTIPETPRYGTSVFPFSFVVNDSINGFTLFIVMDIERDIDQAEGDINRAIMKKTTAEVDEDTITRAETPKASWADFTHHFSQWKNLKVLIGTSYSWFALDVSSSSLFHFFVEIAS